MADGEGEVLPLHSLDYPCTARLRQRRLFAYLRAYGCWEVYQTAKSVMPVLFHTRDLAKKIREGQWRDARYYITRFAPFVEVGNEASLLVLFLRDLMTLNNFADGQAMPPTCLWYWMKSIHKKPVLDKYPCFAALADDVLSNRNDHARAFLDWQLIRNKAAKVAEEMAYKVPELRERMRYPRCRSDLYHIMPVGLGSRRRVTKNFGRKQSTDIAQYYLQMNKRLPSSTQEANRRSPVAELRGEQMLALFETCLEAGRLPEGVLLVHAKGPRRSRIDPSDLVGKFDIGTIKGQNDLMNALSHKLAIQSELDASKCRSYVAPPESNSTMKRAAIQQSPRDTADPGNNSKRARTTGSFGEGSTQL